MQTKIPAPNASRADPALLGVAVIWGSSYLSAQIVTPPDSVFAILVIRFALAALAMLLILGPQLSSTTWTEVWTGTIYGVILSVIFALETFGVTRTSAANAGLIISLTILMTPILQKLRSGGALPALFYAASAIAVLGVALLTQGGGFAQLNSGDLLILLAALARAVHVVVISELSLRRTSSAVRVTAIQIMTALVIFVVASLISGPSVVSVAADLPWKHWLLLFYLALACTVAAFFIQMWAVRVTSPTRVSLLLGTEPLWAFLFGVALSGQRVTVLGLCGAALVLTGVAWGRTLEGRVVPQSRSLAKTSDIN